MQVTLNQKEIEKALTNFVQNQGITITGKADVTLIAGRSPNGMSATIDIYNDEKPATDVVTPRKLNADIATTAVEVTEESVDVVDEPEEKTASRPLFGA